MLDIKNIIALMEAVFAAMLPDYTGREKQLELLLINAPPETLKKYAEQYKVYIMEV